MEAKPKLESVRISLEGRSTGKGASTQQYLYSLRQKKELKPAFTESSRTGNHWANIFFLLSGRYLVAVQDISNSGKHSCGYQCLIVLSKEEYVKEEKSKDSSISDEKAAEMYKKDGYAISSWQGKVPDFVKAPCECLEVQPEC